MSETLVDIYDQGKLAAVLHLPKRELLPCPVVIYCPGKNGERFEVHRLAVKYARELSEKGVAFLRFDYYGMGLSDGFYYEMTTLSKVSNVLKAYEYALSLPEINGEAVFLGFSDGARIALMAALQAGVSRLLLWSPLFYEYGGSLPGGGKPRFIRHPAVRQHMVMPWVGLWISMAFYRELLELPLHEHLQTYSGDSLIIFGEDDPLVKEESEQLQTKLYPLYSACGRNKTSYIASAGHLFTSRALERSLMDQSTAWLLPTLEKRGKPS